MIRAAAKNHAHVTVVVDPSDYGTLLEQLRAGGGSGEEAAAFRKRLAWKAFQHTASYDATVAEWLWGQVGPWGGGTGGPMERLGAGQAGHGVPCLQGTMLVLAGRGRAACGGIRTRTLLSPVIDQIYTLFLAQRTWLLRTIYYGC